MGLEVVCSVGLVVVLGALFALAVEIVRLRGRARRLEERATTQAHVLAAVQARLDELGREEQTRPEGIAALLATPRGQLAQHQEGARDTFESVPLFDPEPSNAPGVEQEAAE